MSISFGLRSVAPCFSTPPALHLWSHAPKVASACASQSRLLYGGPKARPVPWNSSCKTISGLRSQIARRPGKVRTIFSHAVIRHYAELPDDYRDEVGLPFRRTELSQGEVLSIFGPRMEVGQANLLLRVLHGRRVAGTLDDPGLQRATSFSSFHQKRQQAALQYLRKTVPVDEVINAGLRAEDELQDMERQEQAANKDENAGEAADIASVTESRFRVYRGQQRQRSGNTGSIYGDSVLDRIRAANRKKAEERAKREEEEERLREEEEARQGPLGMQLHDVQAPEALSPALRNYTERATSDLKEPPTMSVLARIAPTMAFVFMTVSFLALYGELYHYPDWLDRHLTPVPSSVVTVGALALANMVVLAAWKYPPAWRVLNRYFIFIPATPKPIATLGAMFSQQRLSHLVMNLFFLGLFGYKLHEEVGRGDFIAVYISSGIVGYFGFLLSVVARNRLDLVSLGASGATYGIMGAYFWLHRSEGFKILNLPPDPYNGIQGLGFIGLAAGVNIASIFSAKERLDIASHLVGLTWGCLAASWIQWRGRGPNGSEVREKDLLLTPRKPSSE
jgi:rhomboid-like protein